MLGLPVAGLKTEADKRFEELFRFLHSHPGPTLVYVAMQQQAETHARVLKDQGFKAAAFHAGMKTDDKRLVQDGFMSGKIQIVGPRCQASLSVRLTWL
jgi:superfamily II DNA helicase RecQ